MLLVFILAIVVMFAGGLSAALFLGSRRQPGNAATRQIVDLLERVDQLEQSAVSVANELRRLEDSQRFTERLAASRTLASPSLPPPEDQ